MRIAYACYAAAYSANGVNDKLALQVAHWRAAGHEVELLCLSRAPVRAGTPPAVPGRVFGFHDARGRLRATRALAGAIRGMAPDVVYVRYDLFVPPLGPLLRGLPVVLEINTNDRIEYGMEGRGRGLLNRLTRGLTLRAASGAVYVTRELAASPDFARYGLSSAVIANGSDARAIPALPPARNPHPVGVMLIGELGSWHGVDKVAELARLLPEVHLHVVGAGLPELESRPANLHLHRAMSREAYREVLVAADFGVSPLALYRKGMEEACPLKTREYLMHGLPVLSAYRDTDFAGTDPWYLLELPNTEDNVATHAGRVRAWAESVRGRRVPREEIVERIGAEAKERARLAFLGEMARGGRGAPRDPSRATPMLKPRPYYHAVAAHERARALRARRRPAALVQHGVRILAYHRVAAARDVLAVRPDVFRRHMELLRASGAQVVRLDAALDLLAEPVEGHHVCVTFDDGYLDTLEHAAPVLRDLEIPATVYLPTAIIDGRAPFDWYRGEPPPALGWAEVAELTADGLIEVGSHSRTHPRMPVLGDAEAREELAGSKEEIERRVGREVTSFCYPAGLYSERDARLVIETGYRAGVTCEAGINVFGADLARLRRTMIVWTDDERRFAAKLAGRLDAPSTLTQAMQRRRAAPHRRPESVRR